MRCVLLTLITLLFTCPARGGTIITQHVAGVASWDSFGDEDNIVLDVNVAAQVGASTGTPVVVIGIGWDVTIATEGDSWLSEAVYRASNRDQTGAMFEITPAITETNSGTDTFSSGMLDLTDYGNNIVLPDGFLRLEFFESHDDVEGAVDAWWTAGDLHFEVVPAIELELEMSPTNDGTLTIRNITPGITNTLLEKSDLKSPVWKLIDTFTSAKTPLRRQILYSSIETQKYYKVVSDVE